MKKKKTVFHDLGEKYIHLGKLMKSPKATMDDLIAAALDANLRMEFRVQPQEIETPAEQP